ncbi:MAG: hypothetical protein NTU84_01350 [Verrucomicrobia bacterium]|jgi:hypothetical protein|nr:hypothetical protein [Verrucomicrobiota bacterium]
MKTAMVIWPWMIAAALEVGELRADVVTLTSGAERLTGELRSIRDDGVLELQSELSHELLRVRGAMVEKVELAVGAEDSEPPAVRVELTNGDVIPCAIVEMDGRGILVDSPVLGNLRIERRHLAAMQFGIHSRKVVYEGPRDGGEWAHPDDDDSTWSFEDGALVAEGQASASRDVKLPENFNLKFELEWERNAMPSLQVYFCDPLVAAGERCDRYYLQYGSAGLELKRESATGKRYTTIAFVNRMPSEFPDRKLRVELQVDRRDSSLRLMLDDKAEGEFRDPVGSVPTGGGMFLVSQASDGVVQSLRGIAVRESDATPQWHRAERGAGVNRDSLISRKDERWTGELVGIATTNTGRVLSFKSDFGDKLVELPEADISTVLFPQLADAAAPAPEVSYLLRVAGGGVLHIASCRFAEDVAIVNHPLLGPLKLERKQLRVIEKAVPMENKAGE